MEITDKAFVEENVKQKRESNNSVLHTSLVEATGREGQAATFCRFNLI